MGRGFQQRKGNYKNKIKQNIRNIKYDNRDKKKFYWLAYLKTS